MAVTWRTVKDTRDTSIFLSSQGITMTFEKKRATMFDVRIEGPLALLVNVSGPLGVSKTPVQLIANWKQDRVNAGEAFL